MEPISARLLLKPAPQQLRLHHLFTLTAVMALLLALSGPRSVRGFETPPLVEFIMNGVGVLYTIASSVAITIVIYGLAWKRKGYRFFDQPGHWLMVEITLQQLLYLIPALILPGWAIYEGQIAGTPGLPGALLQLAIFPTLAIAMVIVNVYIGRNKCIETYWARVFFAKAATIVPVIGDLLVLVLLDRAVRADRPQRGGLKGQVSRRGFVQPIVSPLRPGLQRDPAHWCGVVIQFMMSGLAFLMMAGMLVWLYLTILSR